MKRLPWIPAILLLAGVLTHGKLSAQGVTGAARYVPEDIPLPMAVSWKYSSVKLGDPLPARNNPSAPVVIDGIVYACARGVSPDGVATTSVYALSLDTGEKLWDHLLEGTVFGSPCVSGDILYVADTKGFLYTLDLKNKGAELATYQLPSATRCTPVIHNGILYIGDETGDVVAIDAKSLQQRWKVRVGWPVVAPVTVCPEYGMLFIASSEPNLFALRVSDGAMLWQHKMPRTTMEAAPLILNNYLYVASGEVLMCLTIRKGETRWQYAIRQDPIIGTPAIAPDAKGGMRMFTTSQDGTVMAVNATNGQPIWKSAVLLDPAPKSSPVVTRNAVLVGAESGLLWALSANDGHVLWKYRALPPKDISLQTKLISISAAPAVTQGRVIALMDEGTLLCFAPDAIDTTAPEVTETKPDDQTPVYSRQAVPFSAMLNDEGSGVNEYTIELKVDGTPVKHRYNARTGEVTYVRPVTQPIRPMTDGHHTASISASDWRGNKITQEWSFQVDNSRIPVAQPPAGANVLGGYGSGGGRPGE